MVSFVISANGDVTKYRMDPSGYPQRSSGLKLHLQIPFKLYRLQEWHLNELVWRKFMKVNLLSLRDKLCNKAITENVRFPVYYRCPNSEHVTTL